MTDSDPSSFTAKATVVTKTLVFCTAYADGDANGCYTWKRYRLWIEALRSSSLKFDQLMLVDDGSEPLPDWPDTVIVHEGDRLDSSAKIVLYHFKRRLGRRSVTDFPGWVRSFLFPAQWALANGFDRVIHIESDAFLISERFQAYCNDIADGWIAPWCPRYQWPESAIQVIAGSALQSYFSLSQRHLDDWAACIIERTLPFTHVEARFLGDRFGESNGQIPRNADWATQANCGDRQSPAEFYWWLPKDAILSWSDNHSAVEGRSDPTSERTEHRWKHYNEVFERYFSKFIGTNCTYLEIGPRSEKALARTQEHLGAQARILGVDAAERCGRLRDRGWEMISGNPSDAGFLGQLASSSGPFDIIVDDGGDTADQQLTSFFSLFPALNYGGIYLVGNLHTHFWHSRYQASRFGINFYDFAKSLTDKLALWHIDQAVSARYMVPPADRMGITTIGNFAATQIFGIHFYDSLIVFEKRAIGEPHMPMILENG